MRLITIDDIVIVDDPRKYSFKCSTIAVMKGSNRGTYLEEEYPVYCITKSTQDDTFFLWYMGYIKGEDHKLLPLCADGAIQRLISLDDIKKYASKGMMIPESIGIAMAVML